MKGEMEMQMKRENALKIKIKICSLIQFVNQGIYLSETEFLNMFPKIHHVRFVYSKLTVLSDFFQHFLFF